MTKPISISLFHVPRRRFDLTSVMFRRRIDENCVACTWRSVNPRNLRNNDRKINAWRGKPQGCISMLSLILQDSEEGERGETCPCQVAILNLHGAFNHLAFSTTPLSASFSGLTFTMATRNTFALRLISRIIIGDVSDIKDKFYRPCERNWRICILTAVWVGARDPRKNVSLRDNDIAPS